MHTTPRRAPFESRVRPLAVVALLFAVVTPAARADSTVTRERSVTALAEGVWMIRHPDAPDTFPQGNTLVVAGDREVLVVDTGYLPSTAREDVAQIRTWTARPVRWVVNTHWHNDHVQGNAVYREAFPGATIVAHEETRRQVAGYVTRYPSRFPRIAERLRTMIDRRADASGRALSGAEVADVERALAGKDAVLAELEASPVVVPTLGFGDRLTVDLGGREVELLHLGRGNTAGDVVVWLPKERIVATGDLVDAPVPYLGGGYPVEEIATLERVAALDPAVLVPGHGDVQRDLALLRNEIAFLRAVTDEVSRQIYLAGNGSRNLDEVRRNVLAALDVEHWRTLFAGDSEEDRAFFDGFSLDGVVTAAYAALWGR